MQTPPASGYGLSASAVVARLMLTPLSVASLAATRTARGMRLRTSPEGLVRAGCAVLIVSMLLFLGARDSYSGIVVAMALNGLAVGVVFTLNPLQIADAVPAGETGGAMSFYQLARMVAYAIASALSATVLALSIRPGPGAGRRRLQRSRPGRRCR